MNSTRWLSDIIVRTQLRRIGDKNIWKEITIVKSFSMAKIINFIVRTHTPEISLKISKKFHDFYNPHPRERSSTFNTLIFHTFQLKIPRRIVKPVSEANSSTMLVAKNNDVLIKHTSRFFDFSVGIIFTGGPRLFLSGLGTKINLCFFIFRCSSPNHGFSRFRGPRVYVWSIAKTRWNTNQRLFPSACKRWYTALLIKAAGEIRQSTRQS